MARQQPATGAQACAGLLKRLHEILDGRQMRFMEVCGTHTAAIFQSGLRSILPPGIKHVSGPGCPVCVTHESEVALFVDLAQNPDIIIATFGDLLRVPGPDGCGLKHAMSRGAHVEIVYSPLDALAIARENQSKEVVFLGVGFETTAPAVAASIIMASREGLGNFSVLSMHKIVPPALRTLLTDTSSHIDAYLLPGHVATITGLKPFEFMASEFHKPAAVGGFEPEDILCALCSMATQMVHDTPQIANMYPRAVNSQGNSRAISTLHQVFQPADALWRGLGIIPESGLVMTEPYSGFDAHKKLGLRLPEASAPRGCLCGEILKGAKEPPDCPFFGKKCTPASPVGPCMVSSEGTCAAFFKYGNY